MHDIILHEVGPRDGLQMEKQTVPMERKIAWIEGMIRSGVDIIQLGPFVHPEKVPQMADTDLITNLRTGAHSAVPLKYFHPDKSLRLGLYGAGAQGRTQTRAAAEVFDIVSLNVYDIRREAAGAFAREMQPVVKGKITVVDTPEQAADAEAVICVTQSKDKFVKESWFKPGMVLFPMGSYQECEDACILKTDQIVVDHVGQCLQRGALKELNEAKSELDQAPQSILGLEDRVTRTRIVSPVKGTVKEIKIRTIGGVIQPGMDLMEIVPIEDQLLVEAKINPRDIAFLHPGQKAMVKLTAYDFSIYGGLEADLEHISADTIVDEEDKDKKSVYVIRLRTHK